MSANLTRVLETSTKKTFFFENQIRMPSYLIAIAVGNLEYRSLGRRVGVITEPENIDLSAEVLGNLE